MKQKALAWLLIIGGLGTIILAIINVLTGNYGMLGIIVLVIGILVLTHFDNKKLDEG